MTFSSRQHVDTLTATMETDCEDSAYFDNVTPWISALYNTTPGGNEVIKLNGQDNVGATFTMAVMPGDTVDISVQGGYQSGSYGSVNDLTTMITAIAGAFGGVSGAGGESGTLYDAFNEALGALGLGGSQGSTNPASYVNYLVFDRSMQYLYGGYEHTGDGTAGTMAQYSIPTVVIDRPGYIYVYCSFENTTTSDYAFFDDLSVRTSRSVLQADDYYPFGLTFNSYTSGTENLYKYNGKEEQKETQWYDFGARMYDPMLGRFFTQDRFAEKYYGLSPYQYAANNPANLIDVNGDSISVNVVQGGGKNGKDLYQIHVSGKIVDDTKKGLSDKKLNKIAKKVSKQIQKSYKGSDKNIEFETTTDITVADAQNNPLQAGDHAFRVVDDVATTLGRTDPPGGNIDGFGPVGQNVVYMEKGGNYARTGAHEIGHSATLGHPKDEINPATGAKYTTKELTQQFSGNLMHQSRNPASGTKINATQVKKIKQMYSIGALNRGKQK